MSAVRMNWRERLAFTSYQLGANVGIPLGLLLGAPFFLLSERRRRSAFRRAGFQPIPQFAGRPGPVWIHALSLGEVLSSIALVHALRERLPDRPIVFTTSTVSGRIIAEQRLTGVADAFLYFPLDMIPATNRMLDRIDPALFVLVETDLWPGFLAAVRRRKIPSLLVNGRLSPQTLASTRRLHWLFGPALRGIDTIVPQSDGEADRYRSVGVSTEQLAVPGNLKFDVAPRPMEAAARKRVRTELGLADDAFIWIAGSTHPGEEAIVCKAFQGLRARQSNASLVIVPRHPKRADEVVSICTSAGWKARRFTDPDRSTVPDVVVVDVMGRLGELYHAADIAFAGGSLVPKGGQNPIEPAAAGIPVLFGPDMSDFPDANRDLIESNAALRITDELELTGALRKLSADPALRARMGASGRRLVELNRGTTARVADLAAARLSEKRDQRT